MANGRAGRIKGDEGREAAFYVALPWAVLDSPAYARLGHPARSLLMELARQFVRDNNGRLLASQAHLAKRGWKSADVIDRAKRELLDAGFIVETVKRPPPQQSQLVHAVTWRLLDPHPGYDPGVSATFERAAYRAGKTSVWRNKGRRHWSVWRNRGALSVPSHGPMERHSSPSPVHQRTPSKMPSAGAKPKGEQGATATRGETQHEENRKPGTANTLAIASAPGKTNERLLADLTTEGVATNAVAMMRFAEGSLAVCR
ncbi:MAG: hypothetical protein U1E77_14315 [Inhella sp.]